MVSPQANENHRQRDAVVERPEVRVVKTMNDGEVRRYPVPIACASRDASQVPDEAADRHDSASFHSLRTRSKTTNGSAMVGFSNSTPTAPPRSRAERRAAPAIAMQIREAIEHSAADIGGVDRRFPCERGDATKPPRETEYPGENSAGKADEGQGQSGVSA